MASPPWFGSSSVLEVAVLDDILKDVMQFTCGACVGYPVIVFIVLKRCADDPAS